MNEQTLPLHHATKEDRRLNLGGVATRPLSSWCSRSLKASTSGCLLLIISNLRFTSAFSIVMMQSNSSCRCAALRLDIAIDITPSSTAQALLQVDPELAAHRKRRLTKNRIARSLQRKSAKRNRCYPKRRSGESPPNYQCGDGAERGQFQKLHRHIEDIESVFPNFESAIPEFESE